MRMYTPTSLATTTRVAPDARFQVAQLTWLTISSAVDVTLSAVLCLELWWARKHLASKGGAMRQVVTKLMVGDLCGHELLRVC